MTNVLKPLLTFASAVVFGFAASRITRLDHFLNRYIGYAAPAAAIALAVTVWVRAGSPTGPWQIGTTLLVGVVSFMFLLFCAYLVDRGMQAIADAQQKEYGARRETEAQEIAMEALRAGDPDTAIGAFGLNVAGDMSGALIGGCFLFIVTWFNVLAIWAAVSLTAFVLYQVSLGWSIATGLVMALAAMAAVLQSMQLGEKYAHQVPVDEKYKSIRAEPDP